MAMAISLLAPSCSDFLDRQPLSQATVGNAYKSANDAEAALTGVYDSFSQDYYIWDNIYFSDVRSDNHYAGGDNQSYFQMEDIKVQTTNDKVYSAWGSLYNAIAKANVVLEQVPTISDPTLDAGGRREQIIGEAYFLRAYHYYNLVKNWGGVPLMLQSVKSADPSVTMVERSSAADVYTQIISDLNEALSRLPDSFGDASITKARATKGAANALLAKVYAQKADRDYAKVIEYCDAVINSPAGYQLMGNYTQLFDGDHYNNVESIMEVQFSGTTEANWAPSIMLPQSLTGTSWRKFITPSVDLYNAFEAQGDKIRESATIFFENAQWVDEYWSPVVGGKVAFAYKWPDASAGSSTNRQYIFRLADIMLLKAEALNEGGDLEGARTIVNAIRARVSLGVTPATDKASMKTAILLERRLELAQEGQRWDDLVRNGVAESTMNSLHELNLVTNTEKVYDMNADKELLPIPQTERDRNIKLGQNDGY